MWKERIEESEFGPLPFRRAGSGREVDADHADGGELGLDIAALAIEFVDAEPDSHLAWPLARQQCRSAVTARLGEVEMGVQARRVQQPIGQISLLRLDFLQAQHIRLAARQ